MKYVVEYRNRSYNDHWTVDEDFNSLTAAIEYAAKERADNPKMEHRIVKPYEPEELMVFPSIEEEA
jgi:hypothetical protein